VARSQTRSAAVAIAGEGRPPGTLKLDVPPLAVRPDDFAKQHGASIAELPYEVPELMPSVGECDRRRPIRDPIAS
jgi:hypothetical protein